MTWEIWCWWPVSQAMSLMEERGPKGRCGRLRLGSEEFGGRGAESGTASVQVIVLYGKGGVSGLVCLTW